MELTNRQTDTHTQTDRLTLSFINIDNSLLPYLTDSKPLNVIIAERRFCFIQKALNHDNELIRDLYNSSILNACSGIVRDINFIMTEFNVRYDDFFKITKVRFKPIECNEIWKIQIIKDLILLRDYKIYDFFNIDEICYQRFMYQLNLFFGVFLM